jgi:hypothetical protein
MRESPFHQYIFDDGTVWTDFYRQGENYLLRFPDLADFDISADGTEVTAHPMTDCDANTIEHLYINQIIPLALSRQGRPSFHASVVTVPGGAVAFLGQSGAGKSTLAASFALDGAAFLTDDALLIEEVDGSCLAMPSHASVRLWDDSVEALVGDDVLQAGPVSYTPKARLLAGDALAYSDQPQPLLAAFVLAAGDSDSISIEALNGLGRYMGWLSNSFLLDIEDRDLLSQHFDWTHRVSNTIATFTLDYPRDYGILPKVRDFVRKHLVELCPPQ